MKEQRSNKVLGTPVQVDMLNRGIARLNAKRKRINDEGDPVLALDEDLMQYLVPFKIQASDGGGYDSLDD